MGRNYHIQELERGCSICRHFGSIRERGVPGDRGKVKYYVCAIGPHRIQVEKYGVCDLWQRKEPKCQR